MFQLEKMNRKQNSIEKSDEKTGSNRAAIWLVM
jgi:hypothetical protein